MNGPGPLIKLTIEGFRGIAEFDVEPNGNNLDLLGDNGVGKSSATEALAWALGEDVEGEVIRNGSDKAVVGVKFGEYDVRRSKTREGKPSLVVKQGKDTKGSPAGLLAGLRGTIGRRTFSTMPAADQVKLVRKLAPGLDTGDLDKKRQELYDARHQIGLAVKAYGDPGEALLEMTADQIGIEHPVADAVDVAEIAARKAPMERQIAKNNAERERAKTATNEARKANEESAKADRVVKAAREALADAEKAAATAQAQSDRLAQEAADIEAAVASLVDPDPSSIDAEIAEARERNAAARAATEDHNKAVREAQRKADEIKRLNEERAKKVAAIEAERKKYAEHTNQIDQLDADRLARIAEAVTSLPVAGLQIAGSLVMFDDGKSGPVEARVGVLNDAACIELDVRMAAAQGHKLVTIRNAERLGKAARAKVDALAKKHGIQLVREVVKDGAELTAEIVDAETPTP